MDTFRGSSSCARFAVAVRESQVTFQLQQEFNNNYAH